MDQQRMNSFITRVTRQALDLVDESREEKLRLTAQEAAPQAPKQATTSMFTLPNLPSHQFSANRRRAPPSSAAGSAGQHHQQFRQQQQLQDFQLATNIAAAAPPAHLTPQMSYYSHLQPPNVQPFLSQQPESNFPAAVSTTTTSVIRRAMDIVCTPSTSFSLSQETIEADIDDSSICHQIDWNGPIIVRTVMSKAARDAQALCEWTVKELGIST